MLLQGLLEQVEFCVVFFSSQLSSVLGRFLHMTINLALPCARLHR